MLAFLAGYNAALNCNKLTDCPYNVHTETMDASKWVEGFQSLTLNMEEGFEKAWETVVESQLHLVADPNDTAVPLVRDAGEPGSKDRIDMMGLYYEEQMEKPEDERESAFKGLSLDTLLASMF